MFNLTPKKRPTIDTEIEHILTTMKDLTPGTNEYIRAAHNLKLVSEAKERIDSKRICPDNVLAAVTNILGILLIIGHEEVGNMISTKALSFVARLRGGG